jgi:hypothetical protein
MFILSLLITEFLQIPPELVRGQGYPFDHQWRRQISPPLPTGTQHIPPPEIGLTPTPRKFRAAIGLQQGVNMANIG